MMTFLKKKTLISEGSSSGIGLETARVLAKRGSIVIMAVRNVEAGEKEKALILKDLPQAQVGFQCFLYFS